MNGRVQRTLLLSAVFLAATPLAPAEAGGGCHSAGSELTETVAATAVEMKGNCFHPAVLAVAEGATVRFTNNDEVNHVVVGTRWALPGEIRPGQAAEHRFLARGTFPYSCYLHPGMNGVVLVSEPAPAQLAVSTASGDSDLPPLAIGALGALAGLVAGSGAGGLRRRRARS